MLSLLSYRFLIIIVDLISILLQVLQGYWMDVGQPRDFLSGLTLFLAYKAKTDPSVLATGEHVMGNVLIDPTAEIGEGCLIGPDVSIGPGCKVEAGVRIRKSSVMR